MARQNLRVGSTARTFVRHQQTTLRRPQLKVPIGVKIQVSVVDVVRVLLLLVTGLVTLLILFPSDPSVFPSYKLERAMIGLTYITMAHFVVKTLVQHTIALVKPTLLVVQLKPLLALVVVEVTVAKQNLRVGGSSVSYVTTMRIMNLSNKSLSVKTT